ncbi:signal peptide peptidase SppA [Stratiformator vulcanicus]|uniref:Protease 4 n=1 Tax=Stratiformator vulcanicus TaxID=2527980 RepID=A0A517R483_9PLAN|nr:signal peptide peptidase SppA [Stratiformator vulcanicus]QDT38702.1 Protease 4 [Stratiformator vulcanicus]
MFTDNATFTGNVPRARRALLAALAIGCALTLSVPQIALAKDKDSGEKNTGKEISRVAAEITLKGSYREGAPLPGLFGEVSETLDDVLGRIRSAGDHQRVNAVILKLDSPTLGWGKVHEFVQVIREVRSKGKPVYAYLDSANLPQYVVASAADKIVIPESGSLTVLGIRAEISFYKNMFDKLDIDPEVLRVGKYKSAAEPYTRTSMSEPFREEMETLLDSLYAYTVSGIAESRGMTEDAVRSAIDSGPHTAKSAQKLGLVDRLAYADQLNAYIKEDLAARDEAIDTVDELKVAEKFGKEDIDKDFSGFNGFVKLMNLLSGDTVEQKTFRPKIAVIYASGAIMDGKSSSDLFGGESLGSKTFVKAVEKAKEDETVKAVVVRVNSPGGSALASDLMWRSLETLEVPFVVSMGDVAASGGYYISMGAEKIFAEPGTLTGSIGVVGGKVAVKGLMDKVGVTTDIVARGKNSGTFSLLTPFSDSERKAVQQMLNETYELFVEKAAAGRAMPVEKLEELARGRVYTGLIAKELGLVDEIGTLDDAVEAAEELAIKAGTLKASERDRVERLKLPKAKSPFESLFSSLDEEVRAKATAKEAMRLLPQTVREELRHLDIVNKLAEERVLTFVPFQLRIE